MSRDSLYVSNAIATKINQVFMPNYFTPTSMIYLHTSDMPSVETLRDSNLISGWALSANIGELTNNALSAYLPTSDVGGVSVTNDIPDGSITLESKYPDISTSFTARGANVPLTTSYDTLYSIGNWIDVTIEKINGNNVVHLVLSQDSFQGQTGGADGLGTFDGFVLTGFSGIESITIDNPQSNNGWEITNDSSNVYINFLNGGSGTNIPFIITLNQAITTSTILKWFEIEDNGNSIFGAIGDVEDVNNGIIKELTVEESDLSVNPTPEIIDFFIKLRVMETQT